METGIMARRYGLPSVKAAAVIKQRAADLLNEGFEGAYSRCETP